MFAITERRLETVKVLLANRADVRAENMAGETALIIAKRIGSKEAAQILKRYGARR
jgi:ankyrin repeat protein